MRRSPRTVVVALLLAAIAACGGEEPALPPDDDAELAAAFQPHLEPLGLEYSYGGVEDLPAGEHLALYVEPTGPSTDEEYLERLLDSVVELVPVVFDTYPGLNSFDICQEPVPTSPDDPDRPTPRTIVVLGRRQASTVEDWSRATLADLITASRVGRGGQVRVDEAIARLPAYVDALAEADRRRPSDDEDGGY